MSDGPGRPRCSAVKADGSPCGQRATSLDPPRCLWHDENRQELAAAARKRGLETASRRVPVLADDPPPPLEMSLDGVVRHQAWLIQQAAANKITPSALSSLTSALRNLRTALEKRDLEGQLEEGKAALKNLHRRMERQ